MKSHSKHLLRRTLSFMVMCAMVLSLLPAVTFAAGERAAGQRTYYVSVSGKGGNNGLSQSAPLPGLDAVPWDQLLPGDSVLLKKGDTFPGMIRLVDVHGTADAPITIGTYGDGTAPVIEARGQGIWLPKTGNGNGYDPGKYVSSGITLYDCSYITVEGLTILNIPDAIKTNFENLTKPADGLDPADDKMNYFGIGVAATDVGAAEGITLTGITVRGNSEVQTVKTDTSSTINTAGVTTGAAASARTYTPASGTYYVSSLSGSDANDGSSPDKAFYSLHKINELNLQPGAKVYLERGSVFENQYLHVEGGGSAAQPIIIDAYGASNLPKPLINTNGEGVWYQNYRKNLDNNGHMVHGYVSSSILLYDVPYVEVKNIAMTNGGTYGKTVNDFEYIGENQVDGGTVPGETGYNPNGNTVGCYQWGGKMSRTGVGGVAQNKGTVTHTVLQNLDIENVYGNVYYKHMDNGGIYFTASYPLSDSTGISKFDDLRIEGCYLKRTSRWGIAAVHTAYWRELSPNGQKTVPDVACQKYGATNVYIGHNYLEEIGGDVITLMHAYEPFVEYNVSYRGGREGSGNTYHNGTVYKNTKQTFSAGIWPWKCKLAVFEHNECYDMLNSQDGNGDAQAWDADSGDSTIYQYNYSTGNTGGCIMYCQSDAYNSVFRYNISFDDGSFGSRVVGPIDMPVWPNGQLYNNTFLMKDGLRSYYRGTDEKNDLVQVWNNIFYNLGSNENFDADWDGAKIVFKNNVYCGFGTKPSDDTSAIQMTKSETLFDDPTFAGAPREPKAMDKVGTGDVNGVRNWTHDWDEDFDMFRLADDVSDKVVNRALDIGYTGLTQDADFGVPRVDNDTDFFGNVLDDVHDLGAYDTLTTGSRACQLFSSLYEVSNTTEFQVPFTTNNPMTVADFAKGLTISDGASVKVYNGTTEKAATDEIAADMTVKIVAEDGKTENPTTYTIKNKNTYNHSSDWVNGQQGNVWFCQYRLLADNQFYNWSGWNTGGWYEGSNHAVAEPNIAGDDLASNPADRVYIGSGFTFRAPKTGKVTISFATQPQFRTDRDTSKNNQFDTYLIIYRNGVQLDGQKHLIPKAVQGESSRATANISNFDLTVARNDTIEFMVVNEGDTRSFSSNNNGVTFNPVVTYKNEAVTQVPADEKAPSNPTGLVAKNVTETTAKVTWAASTDNVGVTGYKVKVGTNAEETVTETTKALTGLTADTEYTVTVKAVDAADNESAAATVTFRTATAVELDEEAPSAPSGGETVSAKSKSATIAWTASTSDDVEGYEVTVNGKTETVRNITQMTVSGLTPSTTYTASVKAFDAAGNKSTAYTFDFTTAAPDSEAPTDPANVLALQVGKHTATIRWDPSNDNEGVAGYQVKLGAAGDEVDVGVALQYALTELEGFTDYTAYVRAYDEVGNQSAWVSVDFQTTGSSECEVIDCLFEISGSELKIPYTDQNPLTLKELRAGFEVSEDAKVKVFDGDTEVTSGNVTAGMVVKIVAQDGTVNPTAYTTVQKNGYDHADDWTGTAVQGNVWFNQYKRNGEFQNWPTSLWSTQYSCYSDSNGNAWAAAERYKACDDIRATASRSYQGSGFTFRAPADGMYEVSFPTQPIFDRAPSSDQCKTFLIITKNGVANDAYTVEITSNTSAANIDNFTVSMAARDTIEFMVTNGDGSGSNNAVRLTPAVTYKDEAYTPNPKSITLSESEATIYTNTSDPVNLPHTLQLTATVLPEGADQTVTWASNDDEIATVEDGVVTAVKKGTTNISATIHTDWGDDLVANCTVEVRTRMESITVKQDGVAIGSDPLKVYVNEGDDDHPNSINLTTAVTPDDPSHPELNWVQPEGTHDMISLDAKKDNDTRTVTITANGSELDVGEVIVRVESQEHPAVYTDFKVHVIRYLEHNITVEGEAKVGSTLMASTVDLKMASEALDDLTYQWYQDSVSEENAIENAADKQYVVDADDVGHKLVVVATIPEDAFYEGELQAETAKEVARMAGPAAPTGLGAVDCTDGDDGQITGLDADTIYEYKLADDEEWTAVDEGATRIDDLPAGNYQVRIAETDTQEAGKAATVTVLTAEQAATAKNITIGSLEHGSIVPSVTKAQENDTFTLTVTPEVGYELDSLEVTYTDEDDNEYTLEPDEDRGEYTMPAYNVTVTATFTIKKFTIIHDMENVTCDLEGDDEHTVDYGATPEITLTANAAEGYTMPANVTVTYVDENGAKQTFRGYEYIRSKDDPDTATLKFTSGITADLTVSAEITKKTFGVGYNLKDGLTAPVETAPRKVVYGEAYEGKLVAEDTANFKLPLGVTITMDDVAFTDFDYDPETGIITIAAGKITGDLSITAAGVDATVPVKPVTGVSLDKTTATVQVDKSVTLTATVTPNDATDPSVVWESEDTDIATVEDGVVTGVAEGEVKIKVTTVDGGKSATCTVTVTKASTSSGGGIGSSTVSKTETDEDGTMTTTETNMATGKVTETVVAPDGSKVEKVTAMDNSVTITVTDPDGEELAKVEIPATIPAPETKFEDIDQTPWAEKAINNMAGLKLVEGIGGNRYDPYALMTRGSLATVLHRLSQGKTDYATTFRDVDSTKYYAEGVAWAAKAKVVTGYTADIFAPDDIITREQLAVMMTRYARLIGMDTAAKAESLSAFVDGENTGTWAVDGVAWCVEKGILRGKGNDVLDPAAEVTRAEVAVMLDRFVSLLGK